MLSQVGITFLEQNYVFQAPRLLQVIKETIIQNKANFFQEWVKLIPFVKFHTMAENIETVTVLQ